MEEYPEGSISAKRQCVPRQSHSIQNSTHDADIILGVLRACRRVFHPESHITWWELAFRYNAQRHCLECTVPLPLTKSIQAKILACVPTCTTVAHCRDGDGLYVHANKSVIELGTPVWLSADDFTPRGEVPDHGDVPTSRAQPAVAAYFGIPIAAAHEASRFLQCLEEAVPCPVMQVLRASTRVPQGGWIMYHGTSREAADAIVSSNTLKASSIGMLGSGVYLGTFWKAARFASRDPVTYEVRRGAMFRVRVLPKLPWWQQRGLWTPPAGFACDCRLCEERDVSAWKRARINHRGTWRETHYGAIAVPEYNSKTQEWLVKNEEAVFHEAKCCFLLEGRAMLRLSSLQSPSSTYFPLQRTQVIEHPLIVWPENDSAKPQEQKGSLAKAPKSSHSLSSIKPILQRAS